MKTLQEFKEEEAKKWGFLNWNECVNHLPKWNVEDLVSTLAERYAKALLEEAAKGIDKSYKEYNKKGTEYYQGVADGLDISETFVRSLIPKEQ